jgi:hypothetical protein
MRFTFERKYLLLTLILFAVEICIALFIKDTFVRPFVGDALVVALIYCFFKIFLDLSYRKLAFGVFLFACVIEILQYFDYVALLGLENNRGMSTILGRTFEWMDFAAYFAGFLFIILIENFFEKSENPIYEP